MNLIAIGFAAFLTLVVLGLLLSHFSGFRLMWATAASKQDAADAKRKDQIFRG